MAPAYAALSNVYPNVKFFKCDTREDGPDLVSDMHMVRVLPTFVFYRNGEEIPSLRFEGADMNRLKATLERHSTTLSNTGPSAGGRPIMFENSTGSDELKPYVINSLCSIFAYSSA